MNSPGGVDSFGNGRDYLMDPFTSFASPLGGSDGQARHTGTISYTDAITWVHGNHTFKFGGDSATWARAASMTSSRAVRSTLGSIYCLVSMLDSCQTYGRRRTDGAGRRRLRLLGRGHRRQSIPVLQQGRGPAAPDNKNFRQHEYDFSVRTPGSCGRTLPSPSGCVISSTGCPTKKVQISPICSRIPASFAAGRP